MDYKLTLAAIVAATGGLLKPPLPGSQVDSSDLATQPVSFDSKATKNLPATLSVASDSTLTIEKVVYDSREVSPGSLFVALPGEISDGHNYIAAAIANGAVACLVRRSWAEAISDTPTEFDPRVAWILVEDTLGAFQLLAGWWRNQFQALTVVGITGSVGKTSTKELLAAVLEQRFQVFKSPKSVNTEQSLLPVLLKLQSSDQVAVIEMGAGYVLGELERLCQVAQPRIGLVLNVSHSHIGRMGSLENIARNKSELVRSLPPASAGGVAVLNGDDPHVQSMAGLTKARHFFYGLNNTYDLWASDIESFGLEGIAFKAHYGSKSYRLRLPLRGRHSVYTALGTISVALLCGLQWPEIEAGLLDARAQVRLLVWPGLNGSIIIDDSYNASAVSTIAALDVLADTPLSGQGRRLAVLGDMLELGTFEEEAHRMVGRRAAQVVDHLLVVGSLAQIIGQEALHSGLPAARILFSSSKDQAVEWLRSELREGDCLLVKASRGSRLEEVVEKVRISL